MKNVVTIALPAALLLFAATVSAGEDKPATGDKQKQRDALLIAAQKICPVTGLELDAMGGPYRAKSGERTVFLCCKGCLGKPIKAETWKQIKQNLAQAQGICPIMKKPLPEDAASAIVDGRTVFVCCEPCIDEVKADPAKAFAVIDAQLKRHAEAEKVADNADTK